MPTLKVHLVEARNLVAKDFRLLGSNTSDPYVRLSIGSVKYKSSVVPKNLNPRWDQTFEFQIHSPQEELFIEAFDKDQLSRDDSLGKARVGLSTLYKGIPADMWVKLEGVKSGEVRLILTAVDFGNTAPQAEPPMQNLPMAHPVFQHPPLQPQPPHYPPVPSPAHPPHPSPGPSPMQSPMQPPMQHHQPPMHQQQQYSQPPMQHQQQMHQQPPMQHQQPPMQHQMPHYQQPMPQPHQQQGNPFAHLAQKRISSRQEAAYALDELEQIYKQEKKRLKDSLSKDDYKKKKKKLKKEMERVEDLLKAQRNMF